ncbi:DNA-directed RNA polymerase I subunit RPA49 [Pocillopora verrucosa]|uniref:DNA-directed RNA polymerase I subunit RPA49 n=1 Tax=Pocillopora verrucosa TaxID=203993 RepID=UPI0033419FE7
MAAATLEYEAIDASSNVQPLVVNFTNGNLKQNSASKRIRFGCYQWADRGDKRKRQRKTVIAETDGMEYTGCNFGQFSRSSGLCKYVLGVYNERTEVMKMYDTEMVTLQPKVLDAGSTETNQGEDEEDNKIDLTFLQKNDLLTEAFGSKRKKRAMASRQRNKVDDTDLNLKVSDVLESLAKEPVEATDGVEQQSTIPPYNLKATTAADVYKLNDIISPGEYEALQRISQEIKNADKEKISEWRNEKRFPEYVLQHIAVMSVKSTKRLHQSCCLLYLSYMMTLYSLNYQDLRKKDPLPMVPVGIKKKLLSSFSLEKGRSRAVPKRLKDKLVSYILVLALIIDEFSLDFAVIMKDLKMPIPRLTNHLKAVGCIISSSKVGPGKKKMDDGTSIVNKTAVLKVPLPPHFPSGRPISFTSK